MGADDRSASLQQILAGFDLDAVDTGVDHGLNDLLVDVTDCGETDLAQGRQLSARADRPDDVTRLVGALISGFPG
jgi:hypothetical protein